MTDTLTELAREIDEVARLPRPAATTEDANAAEYRVYEVARRVEAFAEATPNLDPDTHRRLLLKLARTLYPGGPRTLAEARHALRLDGQQVVDADAVIRLALARLAEARRPRTLAEERQGPWADAATRERHAMAGLLADAWAEGYGAGDADGFVAWELAAGRVPPEGTTEEPTRNPYAL